MNGLMVYLIASVMHFWCKDYYVDIVGKNEKKIAEYIREQLQSDIMEDQISMKEYFDPFSGEKYDKI